MRSLWRSVCRASLPKRIWVRRTLIVLGVLSALAGVLAREALAKETRCRVIAIDKSVGVVTAKVEASAEGVSAGKAAVGQTFAFHVRDSWRLKTLNMGQGVYANFQTKQVSLNGKQVVGTIGAMGPTPSRAPTPPAKSTSSSSQAGTRPNRGQTPGVTTSHLPANAIRTLAVRVVTGAAGSCDQVWFSIGPLGWKLDNPHRNSGDSHAGCGQLSIHCAEEGAKHVQHETERQVKGLCMFEAGADENYVLPIPAGLQPPYLTPDDLILRHARSQRHRQIGAS